MAQGKYQRKRRRINPGFIITILILLAIIAVSAYFLITFLGSNSSDAPAKPSTPAETTPTTTAPPPTETTAPAPTEPYIASTASVGVTGDIMGHMPVVNACKTADGYDFTNVFAHVKPYYEQMDYMVANLEVNLGGTAAGPYQGYPTFNCPDDIATGLKDAGVDMVLTANNHSYDIGHDSFHRTQTVVTEIGLEHLGTRTSTDEKEYLIKDLNGIKVGMVCYTYETGDPNNPRKQLNGIPLTVDDSALVSSFNYLDLEGFYAEVSDTLADMAEEGAEASMVYIHWGDEYALAPNKNQEAIAQKLCELGVDVIVGGHPHVVEPYKTLTSSTGHNTYCMYSVGNAISNQRADTLANTTRNARYTEDGMIFQVVFQKWNDGTVEVGQINILPTWVNKEYQNGKMVYQIIPLDTSLENWDGFNVGSVQNTYASYERTMSIVGNGLNECREALLLTPAPMTYEPQ